MPSRDASTQSAEMPPRKSECVPVFASKDVNSPRKVIPTTNSFFPSLLGSGDCSCIGLAVSWIGLALLRRKRSSPGSAQNFPADLNRKYFPSGGHGRQHSLPEF